MTTLANEVLADSGHQTHFLQLSPNDLEAIFSLHLSATHMVGRSDLIKPESRDFFERMLAGSGHVIGARLRDELIAYGVLQLDLPPSEDARPLLGLRSDDRLAKLAGASVSPSAWGSGLHNELISRRLAEAHKQGIKHLYATSAPGNARSWANLLDSGFAVREIVEKYGGHLRYILCRDLSVAASLDGDGIWCDSADITRQRELIAEGFAGTEWRRRGDGGRDICYRRQP